MSDRRVTCPECGGDHYMDCTCPCRLPEYGARKAAQPSILDEAARLTGTDRQAVYGSPSANWERTAEIASAIIGRHISARECVQVLIATKLARLQNTPGHRDSLVDLAGYAWVWSEVEGV